MIIRILRGTYHEMKYYRRTIIYTKVPLKGAFQYRDKFIFQPITSKVAPRCAYARHYPAFLDYCFEAEDGLQEYDLIQKDIDYSRKICTVFTALSNFEFFTYHSTATVWGSAAPFERFEELPQSDVEAYNEAARTSKWIAAVGYTYPEYAQDRMINKLSVLEGNVGIALDENPFYFTDNPIQVDKEEVSLQEKTTDALDVFFSLGQKERDVVYSAMVLLTDGISLGLQHQSIGFVSFISSIETMIDFENRDVRVEHCKECGQPVYSVSKKFIAYLSKYVSKTESSIGKFKRLYTLRSKIAHTGKLFLSDREFSLLNKDTTNQEWYSYMEAQQLARLSLFRWLLLNKSKVTK